MKNKLTMQDIADMASVTKSTVSRYFNGGYVKAETRDKIAKIIQKYNYEPNTFAQSLKAKKSKIIGIIAPCLDSVVSGRMLMAIDEYLRKENYTSLFINTNHDETRELHSIENLWRMKVDGIILLATNLVEAHNIMQEKIDIPVLYMAQVMKQGISIVYDDYQAGMSIAHYVGSHNFKQIAYIGVSEQDVAVGKQRKRGVLDGLKEHGVNQVYVIESDFSYGHSVQVIEELLKKQTPDMMICATDKQAMAAYHVIQKKGLRIPEDISITGFGGYEMSEILTPQLTTVKFDAHTAGYLAGETMVKMIHKEPVSKLQVVDFELIEGTSVRK